MNTLPWRTRSIVGFEYGSFFSRHTVVGHKTQEGYLYLIRIIMSRFKMWDNREAGIVPSPPISWQNELLKPTQIIQPLFASFFTISSQGGSSSHGILQERIFGKPPDRGIITTL